MPCVSPASSLSSREALNASSAPASSPPKKKIDPSASLRRAMATYQDASRMWSNVPMRRPSSTSFLASSRSPFVASWNARAP